MWVLVEQNSSPKLTSPPFAFAIISLVHFTVSRMQGNGETGKNPDKLVFENVTSENSVTHSTWIFGMSPSGAVINNVDLGILNMGPHTHKHFFF